MRRAELIIGLAILGGLTPALRAQPEQRPRWATHASISVWIDAHGSPGGADSLVERALATWTRAAGGRFVLEKTASQEKSVVRVRFAKADGIYARRRRTSIGGPA
jgi:hypothetical protein